MHWCTHLWVVKLLLVHQSKVGMLCWLPMVCLAPQSMSNLSIKNHYVYQFSIKNHYVYQFTTNICSNPFSSWAFFHLCSFECPAASLNASAQARCHEECSSCGCEGQSGPNDQRPWCSWGRFFIGVAFPTTTSHTPWLIIYIYICYMNIHIYILEYQLIL